MTEDIMGLLVELSKLASVGLVAGLFSSFLAYRAHRQKKWWELRVSAYQEVISALSDVAYYYKRHFNALICGHDVSEEHEQKLSEIWEGGYPRIRRAADAGAFIFSPKVNEALQKFISFGDSRSDTYFESLEGNLVEAKECLSVVVAASKDDLKTKWWWL